MAGSSPRQGQLGPSLRPTHGSDVQVQLDCVRLNERLEEDEKAASRMHARWSANPERGSRPTFGIPLKVSAE